MLTSRSSDIPIEQRMRAFLFGWSELTGKSPAMVDRLKTFLEALDLLSHDERAAIEQSRSQIPASLDLARLASTLNALAPRLANARRAGGDVNVWQMAGLKRAEVRNAAVLASLWSPATMGDRGSAFFTRFVRRLAPCDTLPTDEDLVKGYVVRTEHCTTGVASERVDITVEGATFVIGIEIKIGAGEGPQQLSRYRGSVEEWARARGKRGTVILLAPFRTSVQGVLQACWQDVILAARETLPPTRNAYTYADRLLSDFAAHVAAFGGAN